MTAEKRQLLDQTFQSFMELGLKGENLDLLHNMAAKDVVGFGTTIDEKIFGVKELQELIIRQKEQSAGMEMHWKINTLDIHISVDETTAIYTNEIILYVTVDGNIVEMYMRFTVVLEYVEAKWLVVHWHGSKPEHVESEKDTWGVQTWKEKAEELEKEVAARTADLVEKNRELEIEAALERIRASTMAMHHTEELKEVIQVVFEQMVGLNIHVDHAGFILDYKEREDMHIWLADQQQGVPTEITFPYFDSPHWNSYLEAKAKGESFFANLLPFEVKNKFYQDLFELIPELTEEAQQAIFSKPGLAISTVLLDNVGLYIEHYSETPFTAEENKILMRFGKVFQQTYTRFLDLQKAEAQAREAQIEASLERIRAKAMSMHHSDELDEVLAVLCEQFDTLGIFPMSTHMTVLDIANNKFTFRETGKFGNRSFGEQTVALDAMDTWKDMVESWKSAEPYSINRLHFPKDTLAQVWEVFHESFASMPEGSKITPDDYPDGIYHTAGKHPFGYIGMNQVRPATEKEGQIVIKFANEFGRAYQRFLDLQKAEKQALEAQIETALEKVRSRSLAMHSSDELNEVVKVLFEKMTELQVPSTAIGIQTFPEGSKDMQCFVCGDVGNGMVINQYLLPYFDHPILNDYIESHRKGLDHFVGTYSKELKDSLYEVVLELPELKEIPVEVKAMILESKFYEITMVSAKKSTLAVNDFIGNPLSESQIAILKRFSKVFDQSYLRFLDLQKAEAQAKEAQIEAALEKVRSRSLAMHKSGELKEVISVLFEKLKDLQIPFTAIGIATNIEGSKDLNAFVCGQNEAGLVITNYRLPYFDNPVPKDLYGAIEKQLDYFVGLYSKEEKDSFYEYVIEHTDEFRHLPEDIKRMIFDSTTYTISMVAVKNAVFNVNDFEGKVLAENEIDIIKRFARVFDQAYTRFLDLQKAEAQAREAQIEASLEKVRAHTMGMQSSNDLSNVASVMFNQLKNLGGSLFSFAIVLCDKQKDMVEQWHNIGNEGMLPPFFVPIDLDYIHRYRYDQWKAGSELFSIEIPSSYIVRHFELMFELPSVQVAMADATTQGVQVEIPAWEMDYGASFRHGYLLISSFKLFEEDHIFPRFATVFDQAYTRFLDLQKAEAQAREAKIETALERVRAQAMAMHHSEDLGSTIQVYFEQLDELMDSTIVRCGAGLLNKENTIAEMSTASKSPEGVTYNVEGKIDMRGHALLESTYEHWLKQKEYSHVLRGNEIKEYYQYITNQVAIPENKGGDELHFYFPMFNEGSFYVVTNNEVPEDELQIFRRFSSVLSLTYRRFNDLQKAEAQAHEAKIEAALERVRSRTMGMQSSEELPEVANLLFTEVRSLGIPAWSCGYNILAEDKKTATAWMSSEGIMQTPFQLRLFGEASFDEMGEFILSDHTIFVQELGGKALEDHYTYMKNFPDLKSTFEDIEAKGISLPSYQINHLCKFTNGFLLFITYKPVPDAHGIFKRFTSVFDQTYTRFLDLKKAEAQTREAQIENALEKVRSRSLAMQDPEEFTEVAQLLREEMGALGVEELETSSIYIHDESSGLTQCWFTIKNPDNPDKAITDQMVIDLQDTWVGRKMDEFYRSKAKQISILMHGEGRIEWIRYCEEKSDLFGTSNFYGETIPDRTYHLYKFSNGYIGAAAPGEISSESWELLKRATAVFSFAYTRFRDLQMAQGSARTAMRQASLDRVRADISSMRNAEDLDRITPLIFKELTVLGVPFIRCGVFIIQEKQKIVEAYLSSPEGNSLGVLRLPYKASELTYQTVEAWRKGEVYKQHWNKEDFIQWIKQLMEQDQIQDSSTYQGTAAPPESLDLHFVPFTQGMLYVGAVSPLDEKELELVQALAKAFSIAYARYEDFVKLEQAKFEVESAMSELKATQSQLVQQEKLASLGQLTAGIAHEIQNPLNFVNNFSEVSTELIDEMKNEFKNGDIDEGFAIADDIKQNLEKINHHGKRADAIVKGMLQHSRSSSGVKEPTDINTLCDEYLRLAYHGLKAKEKDFNAIYKTDFDPTLPRVNVIPQDIGRVLLNIINNAFQAVATTAGGTAAAPVVETGHALYLRHDLNPQQVPQQQPPTITLSTKNCGDHIEISVKDNGPGIPDAIKDKIFQPFFTTKPTGQGTGLGLSLSYDIIKSHGGNLHVATQEGNGSTFIFTLPSKE